MKKIETIKGSTPKNKQGSIPAQPWGSTLDFIIELARSVDTGDKFKNALLKFSIIFMVLLTFIIIVLITTNSLNAAQKFNLIWLVILLLVGVFFVMVVIMLIRTPPDMNLANRQNERVKTISPKPIA